MARFRVDAGGAERHEHARGSPFHHVQLNGKIGLITGGTRGIGAAAALALAGEGADVALVGRSEDDDARQTRAAIQADRKSTRLNSSH